jgi:hypothetical protein
MKRLKIILGCITILSITIIVLFNVNFNNIRNSKKLSDISLANLEALATNNESTQTTICHRIKRSCSCYRNGTWCCMRIIECESYTLQAGMFCDNCRTSSCASDSSC